MIDGFIIDRSTGDRIKFKYFDPLTENVRAEYDEAPVRGRSEPHLFYQQTGPDNYNFSLKLVASVDEVDGGTPQQIHQQYLFIKSFQFPDYGQGYLGPVRPPHHAIILIGRFFRKKGAIQDPSFTFSFPLDENGYPYQIECRWTFRVLNDRPLDYMDVRTGRGNLLPDYTS